MKLLDRLALTTEERTAFLDKIPEIHQLVIELIELHQADILKAQLVSGQHKLPRNSVEV